MLWVILINANKQPVAHAQLSNYMNVNGLLALMIRMFIAAMNQSLRYHLQSCYTASRSLIVTFISKKGLDLELTWSRLHLVGRLFHPFVGTSWRRYSVLWLLYWYRLPPLGVWFFPDFLPSRNNGLLKLTPSLLYQPSLLFVHAAQVLLGLVPVPTLLVHVILLVIHLNQLWPTS